MALLSRVKSPEWQNGDILTHTDLIAEFNNIISGLNGTADISVLDITCDDITGDIITANSIISGNANVSGNVVIGGTLGVTGVLTAPQYALGRVDNLGLSLSSGILKVVDSSGANLSTTNFGFVTMPSTTGGRSVTLKTNSNALLISDAAGTSDLTNLQWGVTDADWAQDLPFFLYAVNKGNNNITGSDGDSAFALARNPALRIMPSAAANIGNTTAIAASDDQFAVMLLGAYTVANYVNLPVQLVGYVRMRYATATKDWTIQTLNSTVDGLGPDALRRAWGTAWMMPLGQNGAATGAHILANGGTAPLFTTNSYAYKVSLDGSISCEVYLSGDPGTDGAGAVATNLALPSPVKTSVTSAASAVSVGTVTAAATLTTNGHVIGVFTDTNGYVALRYQDAVATTSPVLNSMFSNGDRTVQFQFSYMAF